MSKHAKFVIYSSTGLLLVFAWHFATVFGIIGSPPQTRSEFFIRFGIIMVAYFISVCVASFLMLRKDENAVGPDEREEQIELRVERISISVIYLGLICLMWFVFTPLEPIQVANAVLGIICIAETVKIVVGLNYLRTGTQR